MPIHELKFVMITENIFVMLALLLLSLAKVTTALVMTSRLILASRIVSDTANISVTSAKSAND